LCHLRLGHVSERGLVELAKQGLLENEKLNKLDFCDNCTLGKQHKVKFGVGVHKSSRPFEYVHRIFWVQHQLKLMGEVHISCLVLMVILEGYEFTF